MSEDNEEATKLVQRFMTTDEVYVYKIPPLKNADGHRAEDWDLSKPLKTCNLLVERRGDALEFDFTDEGRLFCQSKVHCIDGRVPPNFLEQVIDSSRYFVVKIQDGGGKEALIGFGFRDRDKATDLREAIQHYEKSLSREATSLGEFKVPELAAGEKIHVNIKGKSSSGASKPKKTAGEKSIPLLMKKPPVNPYNAPKPETAPVADNPKILDKVTISMGDIDLEADHKRESHDESKGDDSSDAVFTGDEQEWASSFD